MTRADVVGDELTAEGNDDDVVHHQRRACEAPLGDLDARVGRRVARPQLFAGAGIERVQDSGCAECVYATVAERGCPPRTSAGIRLPEPYAIAVSPDRLARGYPVAGNDLVVTALLLGVEQIAVDRK